MCRLAEKPSPPPPPLPSPPSPPPPPSPPSLPSPPDELQGERAIRVLGVVIELSDAAPDYLCQSCTYLTGAAAGDITYGRYTNYYAGSNRTAREAGAHKALSDASHALSQSTWGKLRISEQSRVVSVPVPHAAGRILMPPEVGDQFGSTWVANARRNSCFSGGKGNSGVLHSICDSPWCNTHDKRPEWSCPQEPFGCQKNIVRYARDNVLPSLHPEVRLEDYDSIVYWMPSNTIPVGYAKGQACCKGGDWSHIDAKFKSGECTYSPGVHGRLCNETHPLVEYRELEPICASAGHTALSTMTIDTSPGGGFLVERSSDEWLNGIIIRSDHWPLATPIKVGSRWRGALEEQTLPTGPALFQDFNKPALKPDKYTYLNSRFEWKGYPTLAFIQERRERGDPRLEGNEPSISGGILAHFLGRQLGLGDAAGTGFVMPFDSRTGSIFPSLQNMDLTKYITADVSTKGIHVYTYAVERWSSSRLLNHLPKQSGWAEHSRRGAHPRSTWRGTNFGAWATSAVPTGDFSTLMGRSDFFHNQSSLTGSLTAPALWKLGALPKSEIRTEYDSGAIVQLRSLEANSTVEAVTSVGDVLDAPARAIRLRCPYCMTNMLDRALKSSRDSFFPTGYFQYLGAEQSLRERGEWGVGKGIPTATAGKNPRERDSWVGGDIWVSFHGESFAAQTEGTQEQGLGPALESLRNKVVVHLAHDMGSKQAARAVESPWAAFQSSVSSPLPGHPPFGWGQTKEPLPTISYDSTAKFPGRLLLRSACFTKSSASPWRQNTPHVYTLQGLTASGAPYYYSETDMPFFTGGSGRCRPHRPLREDESGGVETRVVVYRHGPPLCPALPTLATGSSPLRALRATLCRTGTSSTTRTAMAKGRRQGGCSAAGVSTKAFR